MRKILISAVLGLSIVLAGCSPSKTTTMIKPDVTTPSQSQPPALTTPPTKPLTETPTSPQPSNQNPTSEELKTYKNTAYNFEFNYAKDFSAVAPGYANLEEKIVQFNIPQSAYPKTNFGDAAFSVSQSKAQTQDECLKLNPPEGGNAFKDPTKINGITFYKNTGMGAGAGNRYETRTYRTFKAPNCFELNETIHTSVIENYPAGAVTEVNKTPIWEKLENIVASFKFNT